MQRITHCVNIDDALAHTIAVLELSKDASATISSVPFLGAVIGAALSLIKTIEKVLADKERCSRLTRKVVNLLKDVEFAISMSPNAIDGALMASLVNIQSMLTKIQADLVALMGKSAAYRFIHQGSVATALDRHLDTVDEAARSFNRAFLISIRQQTAELSNELVTFDKDQLRLFRFAEIELKRVTGRWSSRLGISCDEWEGHWHGRLVAIRLLRPEHSEENDLIALINTSPPCRHPYIAQVLGRSHPSEYQRFLVIEQATSDALHFLETHDLLANLHCYLRMNIDYPELIRYLRSVHFPVANTGELHRHSDLCLPSLPLRGDGTLLLPAEGLMRADFKCLAYRLSRLTGNDSADPLVSDAPEYAADEGSRILLSILKPGTKSSDIHHGIQTLQDSGARWWETVVELPELWHSAWLDMKLSSIQPEVGEYGYLHPQTRAFIRLGNAFELMQREDPYLWNFVSYVDDTPTELTWSYVWDARSWRYPLHRGSSVRCAISRPFLSVHMGEFFWFHACNVAEEHGISLQDLILIDEVTYSWQIQVTEDYNGKGCQELFFHQMPCSQTGSLLSPFGCWSTEDTRRILDEETAVSLPGVDLSAVEKVSYVFLNGIQAPFVICFDTELKKRLGRSDASDHQ